MVRTLDIVGGGIAGLALAATLDPHRFQVTVHEAEPERGHAGGALGLWPAARRALRAIGADQHLTPTAVPGGALHTIHGRRLVRMRGPDIAFVPRPDLWRALSATVPASVTLRAGEVTDPETLSGDLVVGADGVRSRVRGLVHPPAADRVETPYVALRGLLDRTPDTADVGEFWGRGLLFGIVPVGLGAYWFSTHRSRIGPEPLAVDEVLSEARSAFDAAAPMIRTILAGAGPRTIATRLWVSPPMPRYVRGRYAVIGDAAHAMTPNLGRGACDAIVDAVSLGQALNTGHDLRWWQARRLPATQAARLASGTLMRLALSGAIGRS